MDTHISIKHNAAQPFYKHAGAETRSTSTVVWP